MREASQQKSLSGLDNIAAEGVASFERLLGILEELNQAGADKRRVTELAKRLNDGKRYLKTEFKVNCSAEESECPDHCRKFALSDPVDPCFNHQCSHSHNMVCGQCEKLKATLDEMEESIKKHSSHLYSQEQKHVLLFDFERSKNGIFLWKSHALRSVNQKSAKQEALQSVLVVNDWAMKFFQMKYGEKQSEWFAKRGLSWHISSVISKDQETQKAKVLSYAHLLDSCCQDWYAVVSILENLFQNIKVNFPNVKQTFLRSDEAGCYRCNQQQSKILEIEWELQLHVMIFQSPSNERLFVTGCFVP